MLDGSWRWLIAFAVMASLMAALCLSLYRSRRHQAALLSLRRLHERDQLIVASSGEGILEVAAGGDITYANATALRLIGDDADAVLGSDYRIWLLAPTLNESRDTARLGYTTDMLRGIGATLRTRQGRLRPVEYRMVALPGEVTEADSPAPMGNGAMLLVFRDLTERSRFDVMLADMQHLALVAAWELKVGSSRLTVSEGLSRRFGLPSGRSVPLRQLLTGLTPASRRHLFAHLRRALADGQSLDLEVNVQLPNDSAANASHWFRVMGRAERIEGVTHRLYGAVQDVTRHKLADQLLKQTSEFFGATLDALPACVLYLNATQSVEYANQSALARALGLRDAKGQSLPSLFNEHQDLADGVHRALQGEASQLLRRFASHDQHRQIQCNFVPHLDHTARATGCWLVLTDVTELKMLEARLHQAEKLQAVGQLTGGVAHDFNNLLGIILGNLQLLERDLPVNDAVGRRLATATRAAIRGSELTRRLLSFARRQLMEPQVISAGEQLRSFVDLLQQTLGEAIQIRFDLHDDPWRVRVDVGQLENALLNLALNARDAMPKGGVLTLSTGKVVPDAQFFLAHPDLAPGDYLRIAVRDSGTGIPARLLSRVFEPFFTTKDVGKGSGLGLAMVHGFAKQSGGTVTVASTEGQGTEIALFLPRSTAMPANAHEPPASHADTHGSEVVLIVEDDTDLRATTMLCLQRLGYRVLDASNGESALQRLRTQGPVDVLFTDLVMPGGLSGIDLASEARRLQPDIRVLLTTGYLNDSALAGTTGAANEPLLPKPYTGGELAEKIRQLLD